MKQMSLLMGHAKHRAPVIRLQVDRSHELIVDSFAGGGGASTGIEWATGRSPDIAINHDAEALAMHQRNHPDTVHYQEDVWKVDPIAVTKGRPVGLMWLSPDCKHHSKAKGTAPRSSKIRGLAWVGVHWAKTVRPRVIILENVEEFQDWGPVLPDGRPCPERRGMTFARFVKQLENLGYAVEWRELIAADYGAPTIRKRLFLIARCDGEVIVWPKPTHSKVRARGTKAWRPAAECIDWDLPCPSIFTPGRNLADNTMRRIARGIDRYVLSGKPFVVPVTHQGDSRVHDIEEPLRTVTAAQRGELALISPFIAPITHSGDSRVLRADEPMRTITASRGGEHALVAAFLAKHYGGNESPGWDLRRPISTITTQDHHHLVMAFLLKYYGTDQDPRLLEPMHTLTTKHRLALVTVEGIDYRIADIGMRMLQPRELFRAQGFPDSYQIDTGADGSPLTKTAQVRMCGNSVCPPNAAALVAANYVEHRAARRASR